MLNYLICIFNFDNCLLLLLLSSLFFVFLNTFHNRNVSSGAAEHTIVPSGDNDVCNTRDECPVKSIIFKNDGYFHIDN